MGKISSGARREVVAAMAGRYRTSGRDEKRRILDEFVALTGYHRKHAIRILSTGAEPRADHPKRGTRARVYDDAVREALVVLWEASDRICGKRLKPLLPVLVAALERHDHLQLDPAVRSKLLKVSASTIDRLLAPTRGSVRGSRRARRKPSAARASIPVRTAGDWKEPPPGYMEGDLVLHCGDRMAGSFASTLVLTDIASGWTECVALAVREGTLVVEALNRLVDAMPFPLLGIDTDNGGEFVNEGWWPSAPTAGSSSPAHGPIERTTKPGWSRRTAPWFAAWSDTEGSKASLAPKLWRGCTAPRGSS
jgi:hypothetical protein